MTLREYVKFGPWQACSEHICSENMYTVSLRVALVPVRQLGGGGGGGGGLE